MTVTVTVMTLTRRTVLSAGLRLAAEESQRLAARVQELEAGLATAISRSNADAATLRRQMDERVAALEQQRVEAYVLSSHRLRGVLLCVLTGYCQYRV